jgi:hypothetical protein
VGIDNSKDRLIESFQNLKSLKLISNESENLENLEFRLNNYNVNIEDEEWDVSACKNLKLVTFTKDSTYTPFEIPEQIEEFAKQWNFYYFPHKLTFIKK